MPAGVLIGGFLFEVIGLRATFGVIGGGMLAITLNMLFTRALRDMNRRPLSLDPAPTD